MRLLNSEFDVINNYFRRKNPNRDDVLLGIGDDCALTKINNKDNLALTIDTLVEGTHFLNSTAAEIIGYRAMAVSLSDLAAIGAIPAWSMLSIVMPKLNEKWIEKFCIGFFNISDKYDIQLIGGNIARGPVITVTVQVNGFTKPGKTLLRSGAKPGDLIYVTGSLGNSALWIKHLIGELKIPSNYYNYVEKRFAKPKPRIRQGIDILDIANSAIDISDGLAQDLSHILSSSHSGACLYLEKLPISKALLESTNLDNAIINALTGGEDYELCFTVPKLNISKIERIASNWDCKITEIGFITCESQLKLLRADGSNLYLDKLGYDHFI